MIIIAHRGNQMGSVPTKENSPDYIDDAIWSGFDVETDLWFVDNKFALGNKEPQYEVPLNWIIKRKHKLWLHLKNEGAVREISELDVPLIYFCNYRDEFSLISNGYILHWHKDFPLQKATRKYILPLIQHVDVEMYNRKDCGGVISDFPYYCREKFANAG